MESKPLLQTTGVNNLWSEGISPSLQNQSRLAFSPRLSGEQKCSSTKAVPASTPSSCPPISSPAGSQWPLSGQPQPRWSTILPRLLKNDNSLNLRSGGRAGGDCTGEREQRRRTVLSLRHCLKKPRRTHIPANGQGSPSRDCFRGGTPGAPSFTRALRDYGWRLWERGCPAGTGGRGRKLRRRSGTTSAREGRKAADWLIWWSYLGHSTIKLIHSFDNSKHLSTGSSIMQTHHQREKRAFGQGCLQTKQQFLLVRAFPHTATAGRRTENSYWMCNSVSWFCFKLQGTTLFPLAIPEPQLRKPQLPEGYFSLSLGRSI